MHQPRSPSCPSPTCECMLWGAWEHPRDGDDAPIGRRTDRLHKVQPTFTPSPRRPHSRCVSLRAANPRAQSIYNHSQKTGAETHRTAPQQGRNGRASRCGWGKPPLQAHQSGYSRVRISIQVLGARNNMGEDTLYRLKQMVLSRDEAAHGGSSHSRTETHTETHARFFGFATPSAGHTSNRTKDSFNPRAWRPRAQSTGTAQLPTGGSPCAPCGFLPCPP